MEICEIQLYHLANKIKNTEVNEAIESYLPAINEVLKDVDREELIKKIVSVEFTRFYNYYNKSKDLNTADGGGRDGNNRGAVPTSGSVRYFINVGEKDGYDWMSLKDFIKETVNLGREDVFKVDVKDSFSFFNTDAEITDKILSTFKDFKVDGRFVNVEVSKNPGGGGRRGGGYRGKGKGRGDREGSKRRSKGRDRRNASAQNSGKRRSNKKKGDFF